MLAYQNIIKFCAVCLFFLCSAALTDTFEEAATAQETQQPKQRAPSEPAARPFSDQAITMAVMLELASEHPSAYNHVQVATQEGVVTLSGRVSHLLARQRAAVIVRSFKGVKAVVNGLEVELEPRPDAEVRDDVYAALHSERAMDRGQIDVQVHRGVVTLSGQVQSYVERVLAVQAAQGVSGVRQVEDRLNLNYSKDRSDEQIAQDVRGRLKWDVWVDDRAIEVSVEQGEVQLAGVVGSIAERFRAQVDAWVTGVKEVDVENLRVQEAAADEFRREQEAITLSEEDIRQNVQQAMTVDPRIGGSQIDVAVHAGEVTLQGHVPSLAARRAAEENARNTVGVAFVTNQLEVRRRDDVADEALGHAVTRTLARDPYLRRSPLAVSVNEGVAKLSGTVASRFDRQHAAALAGTVRGIVQVHNDLKMDAQAELTDEELAARIRRRLEWSPYLRAVLFDVAVKDGVAILSGEAENPTQVRVATQIARQAGAAKVTSQIELRAAGGAPRLR